MVPGKQIGDEIDIILPIPGSWEILEEERLRAKWVFRFGNFVPL